MHDSRTELHIELLFLKQIFLKNEYPENFIKKSFKKNFVKIHVVRDYSKEPLILVLPYLGLISLQTRTMLKKSLKNILNCCKLQIVFKNKTRLGKNFDFKDRLLKDITSNVVYKFQCGLCNESW